MPSTTLKPGVSTTMNAAFFAEMLARSTRNLLRNGDFEGWSGGASAAPDCWDATLNGGTVAQTTTGGQFKFGLSACKLTQTSAGSGDTRIVQDLYARHGIGFQSADVTLSFYVKCTAGSTAKVRLGDGVTTAQAVHTGSGSWERLYCTLTVDAAATALTATVEVAKPSSGSVEAYFDGGQLVMGTSEAAYAENPEGRDICGVDVDANGTPARIRMPRLIAGTRTFSLTGGAATEVQTVSLPRGFRTAFCAVASLANSSGTHDDYSVKVSALSATTISFMFRKDGGGNLGAGDAPTVSYLAFGIGYASNADAF